VCTNLKSVIVLEVNHLTAT